MCDTMSMSSAPITDHRPVKGGKYMLFNFIPFAFLGRLFMFYACATEEIFIYMFFMSCLHLTVLHAV